MASYFSETDVTANHVASVRFPTAVALPPVQDIDRGNIISIVRRHPSALFVLLGGPPCQDVSLLNAAGAGSHGPRSGLREEYARVYRELVQAAPPGSVRALMECTRMSPSDRVAYDSVFDSPPVLLCSRHFSPCTRPRLWWSNVPWHSTCDSRWASRDDCEELIPSGVHALALSDVLIPGWRAHALKWSGASDSQEFFFRCLTTRSARKSPGFQPRGIREASPGALRRWQDDRFAQSPYQYAASNCVVHTEGGKIRRLLPIEEETLMGFPPDFTEPASDVFPEGDLEGSAHKRHSLLGNAWHVGVVKFILTLLVLPLVSVQSSEVSASHAGGAFYRMHPDFADTYVEMRRSCPYLSDRADRGLPLDAPLGPDHAEQNAHRASANAEWVQARWQGPASEGRRRLPRFLPPETFFECAAALPSPVALESDIPDDLDFALRLTASMGGGARAWRRRQLQTLKAIASGASGLGELLDEHRSETSRRVAAHVDLSVVDLLRFSIAWPDSHVLELAGHGGCIVGVIPKSFIYRSAAVSPELSEEELLASSIEWVDSIEARPPPRDEIVQAVWAKSEQERLERKFLRGWFTRAEMDAKFGRGRWRPLVRFAVSQGDKWRVIDNGRSSQHNSSVQTEERIHTTSTAAGVAALRRLRAHAARPLSGPLEPRFSTHDMTSAYRQVAVAPEHLRFCVVAVWSPVSKCWMYGELDGLPFGVAPAVLEFNRIPAFLVAVARRWLAIPVISFYDDFKVIGVAAGKQSEDRSFQELLAWTGYKLDAEKHQVPDSTCIFLGTLEVFRPQDDTLSLRPKPGRLEEILSDVRRVLDTGVIQASTARSLRGRLLHLAGVFACRLGRSHLFALGEVEFEGDQPVTERLRECLLFTLELIGLEPWRDVSLSASALRHVVVISDASYEAGPSGAPVSRICFIVATPDGSVRRGAVFDVPLAFISRLRTRKNQIAIMEALGPILALMYESELLSHCLISFWLDNMSALSGFVSGSSRAADLGSLISGTHLCLAMRGLRVWWDYVPSASNIADGGSRVGITDPFAARCGIVLSQLRFPTELADIVYADPSAWSDFWARGSQRPYPPGQAVAQRER